MTRTLTLTGLVVSSFLASNALAEEAAKPAAGHSMVAAADLKWVDAPPHFPPGMKVARLFGDPSKAGLFVIRAQLPANYKIPAHWHPTDETVTVLTGSIMMGMGDKLDPKAAHAMKAGAFASMAPKTTHFLLTKGPATIQVSGVGPFAINYVNPDDDPRTKAKSAEAAPAAPPAKK